MSVVCASTTDCGCAAVLGILDESKVMAGEETSMAAFIDGVDSFVSVVVSYGEASGGGACACMVVEGAIYSSVIVVVIVCTVIANIL